MSRYTIDGRTLDITFNPANGQTSFVCQRGFPGVIELACLGERSIVDLKTEAAAGDLNRSANLSNRNYGTANVEIRWRRT